MLKLTEVSKKVGVFSLNNISFMLGKGYIMGLIGENGSGKTTILNIILGLYKPDKGTVHLFGMNYSGSEEDEKKIKKDIGFVMTDELFYPAVTLYGNAEIYGKYYENYDRNILDDYLRRFKLDKKQKYKELSKGQKLKFQFAFALAHQPKLLVLDEPTANFDPEFREQFLKTITEFVSDGEHSVILATHLTSDLDKIADYITFIHHGEVLISQDIETFLDKYSIVQGEKYKIKLINEDRVVHMEENELGTTALVKNTKYGKSYDKMLKVRRPTVEEIMYYTIKGMK